MKVKALVMVDLLVLDEAFESESESTTLTPSGLLCALELQTFSKLASERVPSECRHCRLTSDIFIKEFSLADSRDIYLVVPALAWFVKTTFI